MSRMVQQRAFAAHESLEDKRENLDRNLRTVVRDSWLRSLQHLPDPAGARARLSYSDADLEAYRRSHPLAAVMPVIQKLLVQPSMDSGLLVAVGDENGRLLWVDGDRSLRRRAEGMLFVAGADWSESIAGTSAPGTALVLGESVQIAGAEHFNPQVHPWSCTAVPLHDPDSGTVLGVVDITGGAEAVAVHTLSLVEATVAAAEAQLSVHRLRSRIPKNSRSSVNGAARTELYRDTLQVLGVDHGRVNVNGHSIDLTVRHAELLLLLALNPDGLSAEQLAAMAYPEEASVTTVRAEMLRLRKVLAQNGGSLVPRSRPYRLPKELVVDAVQVLNYLERGAHRMALGIYRGPVLPRSQAPAIVRLRNEISTLLRDAVMNDAAPDALLKYLQLPEAEFDSEAWRLALKVLPPRSPKRAYAVAHVEWLDEELGAG